MVIIEFIFIYFFYILCKKLLKAPFVKTYHIIKTAGNMDLEGSEVRTRPKNKNNLETKEKIVFFVYCIACFLIRVCQIEQKNNAGNINLLNDKNRPCPLCPIIVFGYFIGYRPFIVLLSSFHGDYGDLRASLSVLNWASYQISGNNIHINNDQRINFLKFKISEGALKVVYICF